MNLDELRKISEAKTPGQWDVVVSGGKPGVYSNYFHPDQRFNLMESDKLPDYNFVAMAANHVDALIRVAQAAVNLTHPRSTEGTLEELTDKLVVALRPFDGDKLI